MTDAPVSVHLVSTQPRPADAAQKLKKRLRWRLRLRRWWLLPLATLPLAVGVGLHRIGQPAEAPAAALLPVEVIALTPVDSFTVGREYTGELVAQRSSALGFEQGGTVVALLVNEGDRVITAGTHRVVSGQSVSVSTPQSPPLN